MSLLMVKLVDVYPIDCGEWGVFKRFPRYKPLLFLEDSFLLGKHELCLTKKEIFGGLLWKTKKFLKGRDKFFKEFLGPYLDPWNREESLKQVLSKMDEGKIDIYTDIYEEMVISSEIIVPIIQESFDEVKFSNITELKLRPLPWSSWFGGKLIDMKFQSRNLSFIVCAMFPSAGMEFHATKTDEVFKRIQSGMKACQS